MLHRFCFSYRMLAMVSIAKKTIMISHSVIVFFRRAFFDELKTVRASRRQPFKRDGEALAKLALNLQYLEEELLS